MSDPGWAGEGVLAAFGPQAPVESLHNHTPRHRQDRILHF